MNEFCVEHNSYTDGGTCVYFNTHPEEIVACRIGDDPDYDPLWDIGGEG